MKHYLLLFTLFVATAAVADAPKLAPTPAADAPKVPPTPVQAAPAQDDTADEPDDDTGTAAPGVAAADTPTDATADAAAYWGKELPLHPKVVHIPIALCILMPIIVVAAMIGRRRGLFAPNIWLMVLFLQAVCLVSAVAALRSGEQEEEKCEGYASDEAIHAHEDRANQFTYLAGFNLVLLGGLVWMRHKPKPETLLSLGVLAGLAGGMYAGYRVGDAGGRLVYVAACGTSE